MLTTTRPRILPPIPPVVRFALLGILLGALVYATMIEGAPTLPSGEELGPAEPTVAVPQVDRTLLAKARDNSREERLLLEPDPLRHLLGLAIDVGPTVAMALGATDEPVPIAIVREAPATWRGRWLWYKGALEDLTGPRDGNPVQGYSIYEATIRLADGSRAMAAFSLPPSSEIHRGSWVRIGGFFLKLRDTTYPLDISSAPMLVGRELQRDHDDWGPITELDATKLADIDDTNTWPGTTAWHDIEEDQTEPLWHLAAFVRDTADRHTLRDWRKIATLNAFETHDKITENQIDRGTPLRIFGTLIRRTTVAAPPNPAGIKAWTTAWLQVRDYGGLLVPVWVPKRVRDLPLRASLEVRGFYYRKLIYEGAKGDRFRVPLFIAADLDVFQLETSPSIRRLGLGLAALLTAMMGVIWLAQRRAGRESREHARAMDARRRKRRLRMEGAAPGPSSPTP